MMTARDFGLRLDELDLSLFQAVASQSSEGDRRSWLAVQRAVRRATGYTYLEIGSYLGGSIQQHLTDPWCAHIISIDKRSLSPPDDRGEACRYEHNSTKRMMENLQRIAPEGMHRLYCYDADATEVQPSALPAQADFCFIDGEHTRAAVLSDFEFCLRVCSADAAICFHDDGVIWRALEQAVSSLQARKVRFTTRKLEDFTFGIFLRDCPVSNDTLVRDLSQDGFAWLHRRRLGAAVPQWLKPTAHRILKVLS